MANYQWVANVQPMTALTSSAFDFSNNSEGNRAKREKYLSYFRPPNGIHNSSPYQPSGILFAESGSDIFPLMPLNSGSNSVSNDNVVKFLSLNDTQAFFMRQWAKGRFSISEDFEPYPVHAMDMGSVGNCVGLPMCPGIEVTWSVQNPFIYAGPFKIADEKGKDGYNQTGLNPSRDECEGGGCQPGDLTKRMACPWQADFFQCTVQYINFTVPEMNKKSKQPIPPTYYAYWWPPQSPWDVLVGDMTAEEQHFTQFNVPMGQQMNYARGINSFVQMVEHWSALAFIRNRNAGTVGYPYFTETERNNELFGFREVPIGQITGNSDDNDTTIPVYYIEPSTGQIRNKGMRGILLAESLEERAFKAIAVAPGGLEPPRSGSRSRR
jgi:L-lysine 6-oxidase